MPSIINKKPRYDVYFVMLVVSLIAILMGCLFLYLEIRAYGGFGQIKGALSAVSPALSDPLAQYWA